MVPFNLALVVTSLVVISIHVFMRRRGRLFCFSKDASAIKIAGVVLHRVGIFGFFCPKQGQGQRHTYTQILVEYFPPPPPPPAHDGGSRGGDPAVLPERSALPIQKLEYRGSMYERLKTEAADELDVMVVIKATDAEVAILETGVPGFDVLRAAPGQNSLVPYPLRRFCNPQGYVTKCHPLYLVSKVDP